MQLVRPTEDHVPSYAAIKRIGLPRVSPAAAALAIALLAGSCSQGPPPDPAPATQTATGWVPALEGRVTDLTGTLAAPDRERLEAMLARYEDETTHQLAILLVPTLSGEAIEDFSLRVANAWGLGRKDVDNGILVTLSMGDRQARIELGYGMNRYISNEAAKAIIDQYMTPAFGRGDYVGGLEAGLNPLMNEGRRFVVPH